MAIGRYLIQQAGIMLVCFAVWNCGLLASAADRFVSVEDIKADLRTQDIDLILQTLNNVKQMKYQGQVLPLVRDLWDNKKEIYPDLQWEIINSDIIRIDIANVLLQAQRNGRIQIDTNGIYDFVAGLVDSSDVQVAQNAILTLSLINESRSAEKIMSAAKRQNKWTFRSSIVALLSMCHSSAEKALDQLEMSVRDNAGLRAEIQKDRQKMAAYRTRTAICDRGEGAHSR